MKGWMNAMPIRCGSIGHEHGGWWFSPSNAHRAFAYGGANRPLARIVAQDGAILSRWTTAEDDRNGYMFWHMGGWHNDGRDAKSEQEASGHLRNGPA